MSTRAVLSLVIAVLLIAVAGAAFMSYRALGRADQQQQQILLLQARIDEMHQAFVARLSQLHAQRQLPRLVQAPTPSEGPETSVSVRNNGTTDASISKFVFSVEDVAQAGVKVAPIPPPGLRIAFTTSEYDADSQRFERSLDAPHSVPGGSTLMLRLAVDDQKQRGHVYVGSLEVHYQSSKLVVPHLALPVIVQPGEAATADTPPVRQPTRPPSSEPAPPSVPQPTPRPGPPPLSVQPPTPAVQQLPPLPMASNPEQPD
jgi:hypothetical protein